jgi:lysophospholipase L1-like esterase
MRRWLAALFLLTVPLPRLPAAMTTIVALGDSTTAGTPQFRSPIEAPPNGRGNEQSQFAYWLMHAHTDWRVLNRGVNGETASEIEARFDRDVLAAQPAVVIVIAGVNDVYGGSQPSEVTRVLRAMYDRAARAHIRVVAGSIVPYNSATPVQNARMHEINQWIAAEAARDSNIIFADTRKAVGAPGQPDRLAGSPDGLHPDVDGYHKMADALAPAIAQALARK